jgi:hypothetical protein
MRSTPEHDKRKDCDYDINAAVLRLLRWPNRKSILRKYKNRSDD